MTDKQFDNYVKEKLHNLESPVSNGLWDKIAARQTLHQDEAFDTHVNEKLYNYESPVPTGLWDKIIADQDIDRAPAYWWNNNLWKGVAAALIVALAGYFFFFQKKDISTTNSGNNNFATTNSTNNGSSTASSIKKATSSSDKKESPPIVTPSTENSLNKNAVQGNSSIKNNHQQNTTYQSTLLNNGIVIGNKGGNNNAVISFNKNNNVAPSSSNVVTSNANVDNSTTFINNNEFTLSPNRILAQDIISLFDKNSFSLNVLSSKQHLSNKSKLSSSTVFNLACPNTSISNWYLEFYASPDYTMQHVQTNGVSSAYIQKKDSSEHMNYGFTVGARISKTFGEHFIVKTGLQYAQVNQLFSILAQNQSQTTTVVTIRTIVRGPGDTIVTHDTSTLVQVGSKTITSHNHYKSFEIPVIAGYETGNDKWRIGVNAGVIINAASWFSGETYDTSYHIVPLSAAKNSNGIYTSAVNLSLYGSVNFLYRINDNLEAYAEPYFRYGLSNYTNSSFGYSQRFNAAGLSLGLRFQLNLGSARR
jgi:hypothetical protein